MPDAASVTLADRSLRVTFRVGLGHADFHFRWLRHNCDLDRHPKTGERIVCSSELPEDLTPKSAAIEGDDLVVTWGHDGRRSRYSLGWLHEHAYAPNRDTTPPP